MCSICASLENPSSSTKSFSPKNARMQRPSRCDTSWCLACVNNNTNTQHTQAEAVRMWKATQQDKDTLMQRKASTIIGTRLVYCNRRNVLPSLVCCTAMMKPGRGKSGTSLGNPGTRASQGSLGNGAEEGQPDATHVVPVRSAVVQMPMCLLY